MLNRKALAEVNGMALNRITDYITGYLPLTGIAAHNIGYAINQTTGKYIFEVDMTLGVRKAGSKPVPRKLDREIGITFYQPKPEKRRRRSRAY
jgi:hypothetical protein